MRRKKHGSEVLALLSDGQIRTPDEIKLAIDCVQPVKAIIFRLRAKGHKITTVYRGRSVSYRLGLPR